MKTFRHTRPTTFTALGGLLGMLLLLLFVQPALAAESCTAPPGTSGLDQYCEALPGAGGSNSHHHSGGGGGSNKDKLPPSTTKALQSHGVAGAAILALTKSGGVSTSSTPSAPNKPAKPVHHRAHHKAAGTPQAPAAQSTVAPGPPAPPAPSNNPASAVGSALGVGSGLLWALLGVGLVFVLLAWLTRRRGSDGDDRPAPQNA